MRQKSETSKTTPEQIVKDIRRATRKHYSAEDEIRIVLEGLRGEYSIAELCHRGALPRACITACRRSSSKPASVGRQATRNVRQPLRRSRSCGAKFAT